MDLVIERANGSTFLEISKSNFREIKTSFPPLEVHNKFILQLDLLFKQLTLNLKENKELETLRDLILPKLMSGELEVKAVKDQLTTA